MLPRSVSAMSFRIREILSCLKVLGDRGISLVLVEGLPEAPVRCPERVRSKRDRGVGNHQARRRGDNEIARNRT